MSKSLHSSDLSANEELATAKRLATGAHLQPAHRVASAVQSAMPPLDAARHLLDRGQFTQVDANLRRIIKASRGDQSLLAEAWCLLSEGLEMQGRYREALDAVARYESPSARARLNAETAVRLCAQLSLAYKGVGDQPKAVALLNAALHETAKTDSSEAQLGAINAALASVYRSLNEYLIARDYDAAALKHFRRTGDWRGLAGVNLGLGVAASHEGRYEAAINNFEQVIQLVGTHPAVHLLGRAYNGLAGACWFLRRPHDGIRYLEQAVSYYEGTEHKTNAVYGYNNLGINLILVGQWGQAQQALERALAICQEIEGGDTQQPILAAAVLDSLGELQLLRGDLVAAEQLLEDALRLATQSGNKWYAGQVLRTLCRCYLATNNGVRALEKGHEAVVLARRIGDRQAQCQSQLLTAEAHLRCGALAECVGELRQVADEAVDSCKDLFITGEVQRLSGLVAIRQGDVTLAAHHFSRSLTISEMSGDRYRDALAHYELGRVYAAAHSPRATEHLQRALQAFHQLGAQRDSARAESRLQALTKAAPHQPSKPVTSAHLLTLRLAEAATSRELLLREVAAVVYQEMQAAQVMVVEADTENRPRVVVAYGYLGEEPEILGRELLQATIANTEERVALTHGASVIRLHAAIGPPALLCVRPRITTHAADTMSFTWLARLAELGMEVCALRQRAGTHQGEESQSTLAASEVMPNFIYSSPAMTHVVEEVQKIRSSDVTVLITGESGTGKELVARLVHTLSMRRDKAFVAFNCTAVPKELAEAYLFGYRRGAFTGAVADSEGVIRSASDGTLFLDEIGDLPPEVQPKLLRFLQEGEVQPLGESRPRHTDVRIIAATNSNLEQMVAEGRFREDLYYRLNVIRVAVPALRERRSEIPALVGHYVEQYAEKFKRRNVRIDPQTVDALMVAPWPGNVRQLCNEVQRLVARAADGALITPEQMSPQLRHSATTTTPPLSSVESALISNAGMPNVSLQPSSVSPLTLAEALGEVEQRMITEAMQRHAGNISRVARELGLTRRGLKLKLKREGD